MRVELVNTGDELLVGRCQNSHLVFLGEQLAGIGARIARQVAVPDGEAVGEALRECFGRCDVLLVTGGLGPTRDDVTREAAAGLLGRAMEVDEEVVGEIERRMRARGRSMSVEMRRQAMVPDGAEVLRNPHGTAPGLYFPPTRQSPHLFLLPGPPRELRPMVVDLVVPRLRAMLGGAAPAVTRHVRLFGFGESEVAERIEDPLGAVPGLEFGYQIEVGHVNVRLVGARSATDEGIAFLRTEFGPAVVSEDGRTLGEVVVGMLAGRGERVATAESCTGGSIASAITDVPGSSSVFELGLVTYGNEAKSDLLGVSRDVIIGHGAVSEPVAGAMAAGCLARSGADHALAVTGIAGPTGGSADKPVGTVFIAVASRGDTAPEVVRRFHPLDRSSFKEMVTRSALDLLRRRLL